MSSNQVFTGVVESRDDPLKMGRCKVRIIGIHTDDKTVLPTESLPWAMAMLPITSAGMNGIGSAPVGPVPGSYVAIKFMDEQMQTPIMIGTIPIIPQSEATKQITRKTGMIILDGKAYDSTGSIVKDILDNPIDIESIYEDILGDTIDSILHNKLSPIINETSQIIENADAIAEDLVSLPGELAACTLENAANVALDAISGIAGPIINAVDDVIEDVVDTVDDLIAEGLKAGTDFIESAIGGPLAIIENGISRVGSVVSTTRSAVDSMTSVTLKELCTLPKWKQIALIEDRSGSLSKGFNDPSGKYPLKTMLDESSTNRLSRGITEKTPIDFINKSRAVEVSLPNSKEKWNQPKLEFGGQYPYSSVTESESGHMTIIDDTPGKECTCNYHRSGCYNYTNAKGEQVTKIVNNNYTIVDKNGFVKIEGNCSIAIGGEIRLIVNSNSNIQIIGDSFIRIDGNSTIETGGNLSVITSGKTMIESSGNIDVTSSSDINIKGSKINLN